MGGSDGLRRWLPLFSCSDAQPFPGGRRRSSSPTVAREVHLVEEACAAFWPQLISITLYLYDSARPEVYSLECSLAAHSLIVVYLPSRGDPDTSCIPCDRCRDLSHNQSC